MQPSGIRKVRKSSSAPLLNALNRAQAAIIPTYKRRETVIQLYVTDEQEKSKPEEFADRFRSWKQASTEGLKAQLAQDLNPKRAERLILMLLSRNRPDGSVLWTAGPKEYGADFIVTVDNGYGLSTRMGVQAKMHWDAWMTTQEDWINSNRRSASIRWIRVCSLPLLRV